MIVTVTYHTDSTIFSLFVAQAAVMIALLVLEQVSLRVIQPGRNNKHVGFCIYWSVCLIYYSNLLFKYLFVCDHQFLDDRNASTPIAKR